MLLLSCMTGTSYDAFDVALAEVALEGETLVLVPRAFTSSPVPLPLREQIAAILPPDPCTIEQVCALDAELGRAVGAVVAGVMGEGGRGADAIVWSGQTVHHWVQAGVVRGTLQLGRAAFVAEATGLPVISDLRARDVACGGQGAPLVALVDALLLGENAQRSGSSMAALNLGGISNLTVVRPDRSSVAYDVGPANALIDAAAVAVTGGRLRHDLDGRLAAAGSPSPQLMERLLADPYLEMPPPKSTGKECYHGAYLAERYSDLSLSDVDLLATVTEHAAEIVSREVRGQRATRLLVSGGGVRNPVLMHALRRRLPEVELLVSDDLGLPSQAKEALAFAVLGFLSWHGLPANLPSCTGADRQALLGSLTPGAGPLDLPTPVRVAPRRLVVDSEP